MTRLVLASASPARRRLLEDAGLCFEVIPSDVDESLITAPEPARHVQLLAAAKARRVAADLAGAGTEDALVIGCDSMLEFDGTAHGKPATPAEATALWARLAGRSGTLHSGHCLVTVRGGGVEKESVDVASTTVRFGRPDADEIAAYVASGEPLRVAGGFTLDNLGGWFVEGIEGDHGNVLGLSLPLLRRMLREHGVRVTDLWR